MTMGIGDSLQMNNKLHPYPSNQDSFSLSRFRKKKDDCIIQTELLES